jgi:hypothetical protein
MHRLRDQAHTNGGAHTADGIETRFTTGPKGFVQSFPRNTGILRNLRHAPRAGNIAERGSQESWVVRFQNGSKVRSHVFFAVQVLGSLTSSPT